MYALCASGAVNTQGFVWKVFMRYIKNFIHSFIQNTKCMQYYQSWTGREKTQNVCIIINGGQGESKYKMYALLSMLTGRDKIQNVCLIISVGQGDTKYKMHVSMSDRE